MDIGHESIQSCSAKSYYFRSGLRTPNNELELMEHSSHENSINSSKNAFDVQTDDPFKKPSNAFVTTSLSNFRVKSSTPRRERKVPKMGG